MFKSLRNRVIATALITVAFAASAILLVISLLIEPVVEQQQYNQMQSTLSEAIEHDGEYPIEHLASHLATPGISIVIDADSETFASGALAQIITEDVQVDGASYIQMSTNLPISEAKVTLLALKTSIYELWTSIFAIGVPTILVTLLIVAFALQKATKVALQPLDDMTSLATEIAQGESGKRLKVADVNTELGRTAVAFDLMLDTLEASLKRAKQAEERLRQLCADVAHELRSPLASIVASADNLMRNAGQKNSRELAETTALNVVRDGQRAAHIVGDLTLAAQLDVDELAKRQLILQTTDLVDLLERAVSSFELHTQHQLRFESKLQLNKKFANVDPQRVQQILSNLLENANRFAKTYIEVKAHRDDARHELVIQVINDGPAIPKTKREVIFDRFAKLDTSRDRTSGGSGLGLYISRSLAEAHNGSLKCVDSPVGVCFELRLPIVLR